MDLTTLALAKKFTLSVVGESSGSTTPNLYITTTTTIPTTGWDNNSITVNVSGVTATNDIIVAPAPESVAEWTSCGIVCTAQNTDTLTFTTTTVPANALTANIMIFNKLADISDSTPSAEPQI